MFLLQNLISELIRVILVKSAAESKIILQHDSALRDRLRSTQAGLIDILSSYMADAREHILNSWGQSGSYKNVQSNLCEKPIKNIEKTA